MISPSTRSATGTCRAIPDRYTTSLVYTDRPVYRPGHTVHWKGILRNQLGSGYRLPGAQQVSVEILDPEGKPAMRKDVSLSPMGTIQGDMPVPANSALAITQSRRMWAPGVRAG